MTSLLRYFLAVLKASLMGQAAPGGDALTDGDWNSLLALAQSHQVLPLFCHSAPIPSHLTGHKSQLHRQVAMQAIRTEEFLHLYASLRREGLTPLVVKGILCRNLYLQPDFRPSSDEDLLIPPDQWERTLEAVRAMGMEMTSTGHVVSCHRPGHPLHLELHRTPFPPESQAYGHWNALFSDMFQRAGEVEIQDTSLFVPDPTDHLFYLICHALKHFLHSGFGIRQVCDMVLFAQTQPVDWQRLMGRCRAIGAERFAPAIFRIGENFLGFDRKKAHYPLQWQIPVDEIPLLEDLLQAGVYGNASLSRIHSSNMTLAAASNLRGGLLGSLFPPRHRLIAQYDYLESQPWLLPLAWTQRLLGYAKQIRPSNSPAEAARIGKDRIALLKFYCLVP